MKEHHTQEYWELHKATWQEQFDGLDYEIKQLIYRDPHGREARELEKLVKREMREPVECHV